MTNRVGWVVFSETKMDFLVYIENHVSVLGINRLHALQFFFL